MLILGSTELWMRNLPFHESDGRTLPAERV